MNESECRKERKVRLDLVRFSRWLSRIGFTPGTAGNLSVRLDDQRLLVTPTGISKRLVKACDMVLVDLEGRPVPGSKRVTSEINMHLAVYQEREDIKAVVHCHPPIATAFACSGRGIDQILCQEAVMTVGTIPLAPYATTGTGEVAISMMPLLQENEAMLLENHGAVSYGNTLLDAFMKMETIEHLAHIALVAHQLGSARPLGQEQIQQLQSARAKYLQDGHDGLAEVFATQGKAKYGLEGQDEKVITDSLTRVSA